MGDPQQLPATLFSDRAKRAGYGRSLFERLAMVGHPTVRQLQPFTLPLIIPPPRLFRFALALLFPPFIPPSSYSRFLARASPPPRSPSPRCSWTRSTA